MTFNEPKGLKLYPDAHLEIEEILATNIKVLTDFRGKSLDEVAAAAGISPADLAAFLEDPKLGLNVIWAFSLAWALRVSPAALLGIDETLNVSH